MDSVNPAFKASVAFEWIAPPTDLAEIVHTFYVAEIGLGEIDEPMPAYSAQLALVSEGSLEMEFSRGRIARQGGLLLKAPQLSAGRIRVAGPCRAVGASLTPLGWFALTGLSADKVHDCHVAPDTFMMPQQLREIERSHSGPESVIKFLESVLRSAPHSIKPRYRDFVWTVTEWLGSALNPAIEDLYASFPLSPRQVQRLCRRFFGASPTQVLMRHRAVRAAMLLSNPGLPQSLRDEVITAYFDQAHMIRDIRRFTGRTPADLALPSLTQEGLDPAGHGKTAEVLFDGQTDS
ncbi:MAG: helix-turn-helix domain-containing protein [Pseudomonadota bacterium]